MSKYSNSYHNLKGLYGVAYNCSSKNNKYCDDWYTTKYKQIYSDVNSLKSLNHLKSLKFNHIRTYYLNPDLDHTDFLNTCDQLNLSIEIGISNDLLDTKNIQQIKKIISNVKSHKCVKIYTVGNEYFNDIRNIIYCIELIYTMDSSRYIMHSSIFDDNFNTATNIYKLVPDYIKEKYIVGINMYFYNNPGKQHGDVIQNVIAKYYANNILSNSYLIISEYGTNNNDYDAIWNFSFGNLECLKKFPKYLGYELFSYSDESWKGKHLNENNYGILTEEGEPKPTYYAIQNFKNISGFADYFK